MTAMGLLARGESFLRVHWVAVPEAMRAWRANSDDSVVSGRFDAATSMLGFDQIYASDGAVTR
jgi:hypothetical protein